MSESGRCPSVRVSSTLGGALIEGNIVHISTDSSAVVITTTQDFITDTPATPDKLEKVAIQYLTRDSGHAPLKIEGGRCISPCYISICNRAGG